MIKNKYYSDQVLLCIAKKFGLPESERSEWQRDLEEAAQYYWENVEESTGADQENRETKEVLLRMIAAIHELNEALEAVDHDTWGFLADHSLLLRDGYHRPYMQFEPMDEYSNYFPAEVFTYIEHRFGNETRTEEQQGYLFDAVNRLNVVSNIARHVNSTHFNQKRGPKPNLPLRHWAKTMTWFWARYRREKPTYDAQNGEAVSESAEFVVAALKQVDPTIPERKVLTALRAIMERAPDGPVSSLQKKDGSLVVFLPTDTGD